MARQQGYRRTAAYPHGGAIIAGPAVGKLYATQIAILAVAGLCSLWVDITTAYSVVLGGLISIGPGYYFARQAFRFRGARFARHITQAFYAGEAGKFLLTGSAFALVFALVRPLHAAAMFAAFLGMTVVQWVASARLIAH